MEYQPQIIVAVYDDGLLIVVDGKPYHYGMTLKQQLEMASELIEKSARNDVVRKEKENQKQT